MKESSTGRRQEPRSNSHTHRGSAVAAVAARTTSMTRKAVSFGSVASAMSYGRRKKPAPLWMWLDDVMFGRSTKAHLVPWGEGGSLCGQWGPWTREMHQAIGEEWQCKQCVRSYYKQVMEGRYE